MKTNLLAIPILFIVFHAAANESRPCFDQLPGDEHARIDDHENTKITKLAVGSPHVHAYVATQYLGASNLQAEVYLYQDARYCLAGTLGAATDFHLGKARAAPFLRDIVVESKSGPSQFRRTFSYVPDTRLYRVVTCQTRTDRTPWKRCSAAAFDGR